MTTGFLALNKDNKVLVSSETRNLHFLGKAAYNSTIKTFDGYGGLRQYTFRIDCNVTPVPFITMPTADAYGVSAVRQITAGTWEIEVIRSGVGDTIPQVYVFCDPRGFSATRDSRYGMLVLANDGTPSFDSRLSPLLVTNGFSVTQTSNPLTVAPSGLDAQYCNSDPGGQMGPNNDGTAVSYTQTETKPIFFYPTLSQSEREFAFYASQEVCDGFDAYGNCVGAKRNYSWTSRYWAFYRGGIKRGSGSIIPSWITCDYGCNWDYRKDSSFIGIGTGGASGTSGTWPYSNETLNIAPISVIVSDAAYYD
jgi:hypothetical protein